MATNTGSTPPAGYGGGPGGIYGGPQFGSDTNSSNSLQGYGDLASLFSQYYGQPVPGNQAATTPTMSTTDALNAGTGTAGGAIGGLTGDAAKKAADAANAAGGTTPTAGPGIGPGITGGGGSTKPLTPTPPSVMPGHGLFSSGTGATGSSAVPGGDWPTYAPMPSNVSGPGDPNGQGGPSPAAPKPNTPATPKSAQVNQPKISTAPAGSPTTPPPPAAKPPTVSSAPVPTSAASSALSPGYGSVDPNLLNQMRLGRATS